MTGVEYVNGSFCYSPESQHNSFPAGSKKEDVAMLCLDLSNSRQRDNTPGKAPVMKVPVTYEQNCINGVGGETSMEESVLQDLETAMTQLSDQTRICFRDALYRLAKNSRVNQGQNGELIVESAPPWTVLDETAGLREAELETNTIDRAVASLVFNKIDHNAQDVSAAASPDFKPEATGTRGPFNCSLDEEQISHFPCTTSSADDAEVPTFGQENLFTTTNLHHRYSSGAANML
ncbi:protein LNK3-like isoform X2 [Cornus florida]|nr:protein LNK3-like isoform X2 [Cornus florida]